MEDNAIKIFNHSSDSPVMPFESEPDAPDSENNERKPEQDAISQEEVQKGIMGETVKSIIIPEEIEVTERNYVLDISNMTEITEYQLMAVDSLINDSQSGATLYVFTKHGMVKIGAIDHEVGNRVLVPVIHNLFSGQCKVYRDYKPGQALKELKQVDIRLQRINI